MWTYNLKYNYKSWIKKASKEKKRTKLVNRIGIRRGGETYCIVSLIPYN